MYAPQRACAAQPPPGGRSWRRRRSASKYPRAHSQKYTHSATNTIVEKKTTAGGCYACFTSNPKPTVWGRRPMTTVGTKIYTVRETRHGGGLPLAHSFPRIHTKFLRLSLCEYDSGGGARMRRTSKRELEWRRVAFETECAAIERIANDLWVATKRANE